MKHDVQTLETLEMLPNFVWHLQKLSEILDYIDVSSVEKDCLVLSQYDLQLSIGYIHRHV